MGLKSKILAFLSSEEPQAEVIKLESQKLDNGTEIIADEFKELVARDAAPAEARAAAGT